MSYSSDGRFGYPAQPAGMQSPGSYALGTGLAPQMYEPSPQANVNRFADLHSMMEDMTATIESAKRKYDDSAIGGGPGLAATEDPSGGGGGGGAQGYEYTGGEYIEPDIDLAVLPISEGYLFKKSNGFGGMRNWRRRYFRLDRTLLHYYKSERDGTSSGQFTITPMTTIEGGKKDHKNKKVKNDFVLRDPNTGREMELYADTVEEYNAWVQTIEFVIGQCVQAYQRAMNAPPPSPYGAVPIVPAVPELSAEEVEALQDEALRHTAYGPGLVEAVRGEAAKFCIQSNDEAGNPLASGGLLLEAFVTETADGDQEGKADTNPSIPLAVIDLGDGTYAVEYTRLNMADVELSVKLKGQHIYGSPFHPTVLPAPTAAGRSIVEGDGIKVAHLGELNTFTIISCDQWDDRRVSGNDKWQVELTGPIKLDSYTDNQDGTYTVTYSVPFDAVSMSPQKLPTMKCEINIGLLDDKTPFARPLKGSPFHPDLILPRRQGDGMYGSGAVLQLMNSGYGTPTGATFSPTSYPRSGAVGFGDPLSPDRAQAFVADPEFVEGLARRERELKDGISKLEQDRKLLEERWQQYERRLADFQRDRQLLEADRAELAARERRLKASEERTSASSFVEAVPMQHPSPTKDSVTAVPLEATPTLRNAPPPRPTPAHKPPSGPPPVAVPPPPQPARSVSVFSDLENRPSMSVEEPFDSSRATQVSAVTEAPPQIVAAAAASASPLDAEVLRLFDHFRGPVYSVFAAYSDSGAMPLPKFVQFASEFDMCPTFINKKELRVVFNEAAAAQAGAASDALTYAGFVEALARVALASLSKPSFEHLYPTAKEKVSVLLEMWGVGDPKRLEEILAAQA